MLNKIIADNENIVAGILDTFTSALMLERNPRKAEGILRDAIATYPNVSKFYFTLASFLFQLNSIRPMSSVEELSEPVKLIEKGLDIEPTNINYQIRLACYYIEKQDIESALGQIQTALEIDLEQTFLIEGQVVSLALNTSRFQ